MLQGDAARPSSSGSAGDGPPDEQDQSAEHGRLDGRAQSRGTSVSALVLAAGEGTRMRSSTPKVLHRLAGRPLIEHAVRAAAGIDPDELLVVVGHGRQAVDQHLAGLEPELDRPVRTAVQDRQLGTGHAVSCGLSGLAQERAGTVVVTYGDIPLLDEKTLRGLLDEHHASGNAVTVLSAVVDDPTGYGRMVRDADGRVVGIVEHKDTTPEQAEIGEINSGVYAFDTAVLDDALRRLSTDNAQGELYLPDVLSIARGDGHSVGALVCADTWLVEGVNDRVQLSQLGAELNHRLLLRWMRAGVTVTDPGSVWLDCDVALAPDVVLEPGVQLRSGTTIGEGAHVGPDTTLTNCKIHAGASVVRTHGEGAEVGPDGSVGPYAFLRTGAHVGSAGKVGTFVEVKNSEIGTGSKVPHLSYVGDATIGEHSNIGAASVFVNYDGVAKHHTVIGSHARTGADNMFVAPVQVGDGAYTAAGSVVVEDVPPGAMAVARGRQRNIEGWVAKRRPGTAADEAARSAAETTTNPTSGAE